MNAAIKITFLTMCLVLGNEAAPGNLARSADLNLMQFMTQTRDLSLENPTRSMACFDYYIPELTGIADQYETSYKACLDSSDAAKIAVDNSKQTDRFEIESSAISSCELLNICMEFQDSISYFECFVNAGSENAKNMYTISANSTEILANIREEYRLIENNEYRCTNASDRAYVEDTANTYEAMQSCLQGKTPVPTTTTEQPTTTPNATETTEEITTDETTTEETTEETTTEAIEETTKEATEETTTTEETNTTEETTEESTTEIPINTEDNSKSESNSESSSTEKKIAEKFDRIKHIAETLKALGKQRNK